LLMQRWGELGPPGWVSGVGQKNKKKKKGGLGGGEELILGIQRKGLNRKEKKPAQSGGLFGSVTSKNRNQGGSKLQKKKKKKNQRPAKTKNGPKGKEQQAGKGEKKTQQKKPRSRYLGKRTMCQNDGAYKIFRG